MVDLDGNTLLNDRLIRFVGDILRGYGDPNPLSAAEQKYLKHRDQIQELNGKIDGGLLALLRRVKDFVPPASALRLLLFMRKQDRLGDAEQILHWAARDERVLTDGEIGELVKEIFSNPGADVGLLLLLSSKEIEEEITPDKKRFQLPLDFH